MRPLFQNKEQEQEKTIDDYKSMFNAIGYDFCHVQKSEDIGAGVLIKLFKIGNETNWIYVIPWIRPMCVSIETFNKILADYPRINIPSYLLHESNDLKILGMLHMIKDYNLYFLVIIPRPHFSFFWLDKYENIFHKMELTYRRKGKLDRMHFPQLSSGYNFLKINEFKSNKLDLIFTL